jgi:hypothetical protein
MLKLSRQAAKELAWRRRKRKERGWIEQTSGDCMSTVRTKSGRPWTCSSNLSFYVGLLSALLAAVIAGLLNVHHGDRRAFGLLIGVALILVLAEVGYSTVAAFYHRFIDAYFTLINIQHMLRLNDWNWMAAELGKPYPRSEYGGFMAQWVDPIDWLKGHQELTAEAAKKIAIDSQPVRHRDILKNLFGNPQHSRRVLFWTREGPCGHSNS